MAYAATIALNGYEQLTMLVVIVAAFGLGIYDFWVGYKTKGWGTISWVLYSAALKRPAIPFAFGFLMGHIFGTMPDSGAKQPVTQVITESPREGAGGASGLRRDWPLLGTL